MQHYRLSLTDIHNNIELIKQNTINRKAQSYANPQLVELLYQEYRIKKKELDEVRKAKNNHNAVMKQVLTIEDDVKRQNKLEI